MVRTPPRPQSLYDFRMQEVSYEIATLEPGATLVRKAQVAGYFYHVLEGTIEARSNGLRTVTAGSRDTVVAAGFLAHALANTSAQPVRMLVGAEPYEYLAWLPAEPTLDCFRANSRHPLQRRLLLAMELVIEEISNPDVPPDQLTLERSAELIIFYFFRMRNPVVGSLDPYPWSDRRLMAAVSAMQRNPAREWTVAQLAAVANMSRSAFSERFRAVLGESPIRMLTEIRLKSGARRMLEGRAIVEAATCSGYGSEEAFNRAFKRHFGVTPGRWLRDKVD